MESDRTESSPVSPSPATAFAPACPAPDLGPNLAAGATDVPSPALSDAPALGPSTGPAHPSRAIQKKLLEGKVIEVLRTVYDPEIPINIYELGLIYDIEIKDDDAVHVRMTLTAPACPVAGSLPGEVEKRIETIAEVKSAAVELVWDPPWSRDRMSEAAQLELGLF